MTGHLRPPSARQTQDRLSVDRRPGVLRLSVWLASVVVLAAGMIVIPSGSAAADGIPTQVDAAAVDKFIGDELAEASIPGAAVAITQGDRVLHVRGYGHDSHHVPVTGSTLFRIASLSKSFTSLAVQQLVDAGKLTLDDPVATHLPEFRPADPRGASITVRQLLDQTSGLADREVSDRNRAQPTTLTEATTSLNSAHLVAAPGTQFDYYNPNYHVAARLVEVLGGETFENYLLAHVFRPAGMPASLTTNTDDQPVPGLADGHVVAYGQPIATPAPGTFVGGAGDVVSTAADMAHWLILHTNGGRAADGTRLVSERSLKEIHTASGPSGYALGWDTDGPAAAPIRLVHSGNLLTFSAYQAVLPDSGYGVALLFNSGSALLLEQTGIFYGLLDIVEGKDSTPSGPRFNISTLDLLLAGLTTAVLVLGARGVFASQRWATRHVPSPARMVLRLLPQLSVVGLAVVFPDIAQFLMDGRDVSWIDTAYGWPALVIFVVGVMTASAATLVARVWQLSRLRRGAQTRLGRCAQVAKPGQCAGATSIRRAHAGGVDKPTTQKGKTMRARRGRAGRAVTVFENGAEAAASSAPPQQRMQAIVRHEYGSADVVRLEEIDRPTIEANEVLIGVHAAGLDRGTWHIMAGMPYLFRLMGLGVRKPKNPVLGLDVAGTVVAVGTDVTRFEVGDEVFGISMGSFAEYAAASEDKLARKPANLTFDQAAVVAISGLTALQSLLDVGRLEAGQHVLILGASGGVGSYAVQIAKASGAEVTGVCSTAKVDLVRSLGADHVIDYTREDFAAGPQRYDLILDIGGNSALPRLRRALAPSGTLVLVGGEDGDRWTGGMGRQLRAVALSPLVRQRLTMKTPKENYADLERLAQLIETGQLTPTIDKTYPLNQAPDAMRRLQAGQARGKIVIAVTQPSRPLGG